MHDLFSPRWFKEVLHPRTAAAAVLCLCCTAQAGPKEDKAAARYYEDALSRYKSKDFKGAIVQLKNAVQINRQMLPVHVLLGKALLDNGEVAAAEVSLNDALAMGVNRAEVVLQLAQAEIGQGKLKALLEQPQFDPAGLPPAVQVPLLLLRAAAAADVGDSPAAFRALDDARRIDATNPDVWLAEVPMRLRSRQFKEAEDATTKAFALAPTSAQVLYQKGAIAHVRGDTEAAVTEYDRALKADPKHIEARIGRAGLLVDTGQAAAATRDLQELRRLAPTEPRGAYLSALLAERAGNPAAAKSGLREITALIDPVPIGFIRYRPQLLMLNGLAHFGLAEMEKARTYLLAFHKAQGSSPASKVLAQLYLLEPNATAAVEVLESFRRTDPSDPQALTLLASAYMALGRNDQSTTLMQEAVRANAAPELRSALGFSLLGGGQVGEATAQLESAFRTDPGQTQAGAALATIYLRNGEPEKAVSIAERLAKREPASPSLLNLLGLAQARAGNAPAARLAFERAAKLDASLVAPQLNLARLDISKQAFEAAAARLQSILNSNDKNVDALMEMARIAGLKNQSAEAQRWLEKANDHAGPRDPRPGLALVDLHLRAGHPAPALAAAKRLSGKAAEDFSVLLAQSRAHIANGDLSGAKATLSNATRVANFQPALQLQVALLQVAIGNLPGARYSLDKALSTQPNFLPAQALMTDVELRQGEVAAAEARARAIVQRNAKRAIGYSLLGDVALARGEQTKAVDSYRTAHLQEPSTDTLLRLYRTSAALKGEKAALPLIQQWAKIRPGDLSIIKALGDGLARAGDYAAARGAYESALRLKPADVAVLNNLANVLMRMKDAGALAYAEQAFAKDPSDAEVVDTLGWASYKAGQIDRALQLLRNARLRSPNSPVIRYHLGSVLASMGRKAEALDELKIALTGGDNDDVKAAEALIRTLH